MLLSEYFDVYDEKYPDLMIQLLDYFNVHYSNVPSGKKSIAGFCDQYAVPDSTNPGVRQFIHHPIIIDRICRKLCEAGTLVQTANYGTLGSNNNYAYISTNPKAYIENKRAVQSELNCRVYGFEYIYKKYKDLVIPIIWKKTYLKKIYRYTARDIGQ